MHEWPRILIGGVPFGGDNVGDEAILECVVRTVRELCEEAEITISTHAQSGTAAKFGVNTCPLYGFLPRNDFGQIADVVRENDIFIWSGATGLSDYPEIPLEILRMAQEMGKKTAIWGVGMNSELNPALYRVRRGKRHLLLKAATTLTFGGIDFVANAERLREERVNGLIRARLGAADLVVVRDPQTRDELLRRGVQCEIRVGTDPAIELEPARLEDVNLSAEVREALDSAEPKVGVCISAQRQVADGPKLVEYLDRLAAGGCRIVFVPMNPLTDAEVMAHLRTRMQSRDRAVLIDGEREPGEILAVAGRLDAVVSSRLHLLIFCAMAGVPPVAISRGSKLDSFLANFGLRSVGSVESVDFEQLYSETVRAVASKEEFRKTSRAVRGKLTGRLTLEKVRLRCLLRGG